VEVAELLPAESGGTAADAGDFDMSAGFGVRHKGGPLVSEIDYFFVVVG
jgi:hypothetical protein